MVVNGITEWRRERLEDICVQITDGKHGDCQDDPSSGFYFLSCKDVANGKLNYAGARQIIKADFVDTHRRTKFEPADILVTNSGTIGRMAFAPDNELTRRTTFQKSVAILKPKPRGVDPRFLYYALQSDIHRLIEFAGGTAQKNLLLRDLRAFEVVVPTLPAQRRIAGILAAYDGLIENSQRRIRILEEMARVLYREWFVHFRFPGNESLPRRPSPLGYIPQGWKISALGDLIQFKSGFAFKSGTFSADGEHRLVTIRNVQDGAFNPESENRMTELLGNLPPHCLLKDGDILLSLTGNVGRVCLVYNGPFLLNQRVAKLVPVEDFDWAITYCIFREPEMRMKLEQLSNGVAQQNLSPVLASKMEFTLPPRELRQRFADFTEPMLRRVVQLYITIQNLRRTRDLLLPRLLSGQIPLDVSAAEDTAITMAPARSETEYEPEEPALRVAEESPAYRPANGAHAVESDGHNGSAVSPMPIDQTGRTEVLQVIRQVFSEGPPRDRDAAIREVAHALGYRRTGARIQEILHTDLLTAVRRGILENTGGELHLLTPSITDYERDFLKQQFLAAIGRTWLDRDDAIRDFCRWLGFARTGPVIEDTARSLINGLLREQRLEADGPNLIRRTP